MQISHLTNLEKFSKNLPRQLCLRQSRQPDRGQTGEDADPMDRLWQSERDRHALSGQPLAQYTE